MKQFRRSCLCVLVVLGIACSVAFGQEGWMPDANLRQAVRAALELPDGVPLTQPVMNQLTELEAVESEIKDLTGLEHAINLTWLHLGVNEIHDLSPLAGLVHLEALWIFANPLLDLSPLTNLVNLKTLDVGVCQISDISPLAGLIHLESLWISVNPLSDISPLANLVNLKTLYLEACQISDISPLAKLTKLEFLYLPYNRIVDITPLVNLTNLTELWLTANRIVDIRPLENLTALEELRIQNNWVTDHRPLDTLSLTHFEHDEFCVFPGHPFQERIQNRGFPSVFKAWGHILNRPSLSDEARLTHHDLFWSPEFGLRFQRTNNGIQLTGDLNEARRQRNTLLEMNPNMIFILELRMRDGHPDSPFYSAIYEDDFPWIKDEAGNKVPAVGYSAFLIDFTHPDVQDTIVEQSVEVAKCGLYDGIFLDYWSEHWSVFTNDDRTYYQTYEEEQRARDTIIQRIRAEVGDDFLIVVNPNRSKPTRAAPYINGLFMETGRAYDRGYTYDGLAEIESTLLWAEENLREPRINCLEGWGVPTESPDSLRNLSWMRVFTTMSLTHSDGYVLYNDGTDHIHYWYDFWDANLGQPVGEKAQLYENRDGLFIREFTNGWAVYNRSGKSQEISLPEQAMGVESGLKNTIHIIPDLDGEIYLKSGLQTLPTVDVNGDGVVNILDLVAVANAFGKDAPDVNGDGVVNILDLVAVANAFESP